MNVIRYGISAALLSALLGLSLAAGSTGCHHCDIEKVCLQKEGLLVQGEIYPICGVDASHDGDEYTWETDSGSCSCTLELSDFGEYHWRGCAFDAN